MDKVVKVYRNKSPIINDAFDNAVFNLCMNKERHDYKVFYLCGCEPCVGTTSVAVELSISLAVSGWKTLLLDGDLRKGNSYKRLNENAVVGLSDYINGKRELNDIIHRTNWENLLYISCGNVGEGVPLKMLYSSKMSQALQKLKDVFDYIIIDGPAISSSVDSEFYSLRADATILVAAMNNAQKKHLEQAYQRLTENEANVIGVIENKVSLKEYREYTKDYDYFNDKKFVGNTEFSNDETITDDFKHVSSKKNKKSNEVEN